MLPGWDKIQDLRKGAEAAAAPSIEQLPKPDITKAIEDRTDSLVIERLLHKKGLTVDRLKEKLTQAAGVVGRVTAKLEEKADFVIAREDAINKRGDRLFDAKHAILDSADAGLDAIEAHLSLVSNDPLPGSET